MTSAPRPAPSAFVALGWLGLGLGFGLVFIHPLCRLLFDCGCTWWWAGADTHCNIHHAAPPHCPWCAGGPMGFASVLLAMLILQALGLHLLRRRGATGIVASIWLPLATLVFGFLGSALGSGLAAALIGRYPSFLGFPLSPLF